jgi:glutamate/tyrosine decarboxylase-like PLP-dependent enzyme
LQCGRKADCFKLWLTWKRYGIVGFENRIDKAFENTQYFVSLLKKNSDKFYLIDDPLGQNVCFWYLPKFLRG